MFVIFYFLFFIQMELYAFLIGWPLRVAWNPGSRGNIALHLLNELIYNDDLYYLFLILMASAMI